MFTFECMSFMDVGATSTPEFGGYMDEQFVEKPPDRVVCITCKFPSKEPYKTECCGHIFCKSCLDKQEETKKFINYACPVCREEVKFKIFHDKGIEREIKGLHVYCTNKEQGCEWQGELNDINNHLGNRDGCQFEEVKCFNECGKMTERRYLTSHVETECPRRKVNCQYCHDTGEHQFIEGQHKEECPKLPLSCHYRCGVDNIPRDELKEHTDRCSLEMVKCEFHSVGCKAMIARKDKEEHNREMMSEHLQLSVVVNQCNVQNLQDVTQQLNQLNDDHRKLKNEYKQLKDNYQQLNDDHRKHNDDHRKYNDDHRKYNDDHKEHNDNYGKYNDDHKEHNDIYRNYNDDHRQLYNDNRELQNIQAFIFFGLVIFLVVSLYIQHIK